MRALAVAALGAAAMSAPAADTGEEFVNALTIIPARTAAEPGPAVLPPAPAAAAENARNRDSNASGDGEKAVEHTIGPDETLVSLFANLGIRDPELEKFARRSFEAAPFVYPRAGQLVQARVRPDGTAEDISLFFDRPGGKVDLIHLGRKDGRLATSREDYSYGVESMVITGRVGTSVKTSVLSAGVPEKIGLQILNAFDQDSNPFDRLEAGDSYRLLYEILYVEGRPLRPNRLLAIQLLHKGEFTELYWFENDGAGGNFYDLSGHTQKRAFIRAPLDKVLVTSEFQALRYHPIKKIWRPHQGIDFSAPRGTVVRAASDGVVTKAGWNRTYGRVIEINHGSGIGTLYAHLNSINRKVAPGARVKRGQEIGRVGRTGLATGPHLHYELKINGVQINPLKANLPEATDLSQKKLGEMIRHIRPVMDELAALEPLESFTPPAWPASQTAPSP